MVNFVLVFFFAYGLCFPGVIISFSDLDFEFEAESAYAPAFRYDRIDEVKRQCSSVLSSASELKLEDLSRPRRARNELGFKYGDWGQESGTSPILPFDDSTYSLRNSSAKPLSLVSFWVTDLDLPHRSKNYVGVNGVLMLGITMDYGFPSDIRHDRSREFEIWPGHTQLKVSLQGVYLETEENGGERVMCMLGDTMLPSRESDSDTNEPWKWVKDHSSSGTPPLLQDDHILVVIRYPKKFTLTKRVIQGELRSLNQRDNPKYFDKVHIVSQLGKSARYEYTTSENLVSKACEPYPYKDDSFLSSGIDVYNGTEFCSVLESVSYGALTVVPNWRCNVTGEYCNKLGPFLSDRDTGLSNGSFKDVKLYMQDVHCQETVARSRADSLIRVSAVFRAIHTTENRYIAAWRSAPDNMTVSVEGLWKPSSGQLCMVGCTKASGCNVRLCLYVPITFSIRQRSVLVGTFSSIDAKMNAEPSFFPLSFENVVRPMVMLNRLGTSYPRYVYSKTEEARAVLGKNEPSSVGKAIKKSFLRYPRLEDAENLISSLSRLAEDLTVHTRAVRDLSPKFPASGTELGLDILSIGSLFRRSLNYSAFSTAEQENPYQTKAELYTEKQLLLNVSAQISLTGESYGNLSVIYLEGLYDEHAGKMYLVGCRDARASWKVLSGSNDLEAGLDCLIESVVSYPPVTSRWFADPTARVSISSQRPEHDPLYFEPVKLRTSAVFYQKQREDVLSRAGVEGILRILTLSFAVVCITSQLFYAGNNGNVSLPFMSLVMLGVQALGYSLPLITGAEALFKRKASGSYQTPSHDLQRNQRLDAVDYAVKLLVLACFLLTLRLCQKVWKSRARLVTHTPREPQRVPSDRRVVFITTVLHVVGYIAVLIVRSTRTAQTKLYPDMLEESPVVSSETTIAVAVDADSPAPRVWQTELGEYIGLVQDLFLLPQVIANVVWQIDCEPLRKLYYVGITAIRLLPHVYDYATDPIPDPYSTGGEHEFVDPNLDFFSKFGDVAIPVAAVILAAIVFVQQRWDYEKLSRALIVGRVRILPSRSVKYERLQSRPTEAEAELVTAVGVEDDGLREREHGDEE